MRAYPERRKRWYDLIRQEGIFTWDWYYGEEYALADLHPIPLEFRTELAIATEALGHVFARVAEVTRRGEESLFAELGLPRETWQAVRVTLDPKYPTVIGRFDFARTPEGLKMLEFNSDTPTGVVEAFYVNGKICELGGMEDPNAGMDQQIRQAFSTSICSYRKRGFSCDRIFFSALGWHEEDAGTTRYLMEKSALPARFVPLEDLRVTPDRLTARWEGEEIPVDVLYRLHALEILAGDTDEDGYPTGAHMLDQVAQGNLLLINPPSALLSQTKAMQALLWNLYEENRFLTPEEREIVATYMLPTYLENRFLGKEPYVVKPIFGREGGAVRLCDAQGRVEHQDSDLLYADQPMIYQKRVELEPVEIETLKGPFQGHLLWGSFLIEGKSSAILARVDGPITGNLSYFLPVGYPRRTDKSGHGGDGSKD
ncbi:glutathionylspermidine synthase [Kroppenstedtia sanguinis]|uniref:glutathionylspermidine synthase family protein n=1 Tax=Kroppenstedtia sanguinis TaxID=1380684 RepID=UPI003D23C15B